MKKTSSSLASLAALALTALSAQAATVIDFDSTQVSASGSVSMTPGAFTTATVINKAMNTGFEDQGTVFGGAAALTATTPSFSSAPQIRGGSLGFKPGELYSTVVANTSMAVLLMWDQSNFLSGDAPVSLGAGSSISIAGSENLSDFNTIGDSWGLKFVIRDSGNYFISDLSSTALTSGSSITDFSTSEWAQFDPTASSGDMGTMVTTISGFSAADYTTRTFDSVSAAGFFVNDGRSTGGTTLAVTDFDLAAIPEPNSFALISGALAGLVLLRRRRS